MITHKRTGGRTIELFLPYEHGGVKVKEIVISPVRLDHTLRWQTGEYKSVLALLAELSGMTEECLRNLAYPDTDRVMGEFIAMLPPEIKDNIAGMGEVEKSPETTVATVEEDGSDIDATKMPTEDEPVHPDLGRPLMPGEPPPPARKKDSMGIGLDLDGH